MPKTKQGWQAPKTKHTVLTAKRWSWLTFTIVEPRQVFAYGSFDSADGHRAFKGGLIYAHLVSANEICKSRKPGNLPPHFRVEDKLAPWIQDLLREVIAIAASADTDRSTPTPRRASDSKLMHAVGGCSREGDKARPILGMPCHEASGRQG